jgi:acyl-CoA reductase-like NAD-dependent aldehyde dehydrogenase
MDFFAQDTHRVWRVSEALDTGIVAVNVALFTTPVAPFGGMKQSGLGREGGHGRSAPPPPTGLCRLVWPFFV